MAELGSKLRGRRGLVRARLYPILTRGLPPILTGQFSYTYMTLFSIALFFWSITFDLTNYVKVSSWSKVQQSQKSPNATIHPLIVGHFSSNSIFNQNFARNVGQISNCWDVNILSSRPMVVFRGNEMAHCGSTYTNLSYHWTILTNMLDRTQTGPVSES